MQHSFFIAASLLMLLGQRLASVTANSLDNSTEQGSTPDLQPPPVTCHREALTIDFADIGLHFIAEPKKVNIGQCVGYCPEVSVNGATNLYSNLRRLSGDYMESCCVPTSFSDIQVIVVVYNPNTNRYESRLDVLEKATVAECGCV